MLFRSEFARDRKATLMTIKEHKSWPGMINDYSKLIESHPFFPRSLSNKIWNLQMVYEAIVQNEYGIYWEEALSNEEKERLSHIKELSKLSQRFIWADMALTNEIMALFQTGLNTIFHPLQFIAAWFQAL